MTDPATADKFDAEAEDVSAFLVDHRVGEAEFRDLRAHHPARLGVLIEHHAGISEGCEVARHRERCRTAADQCDALAVALLDGLR